MGMPLSLSLKLTSNQDAASPAQPSANASEDVLVTSSDAVQAGEEEKQNTEAAATGAD